MQSHALPLCHSLFALDIYPVAEFWRTQKLAHCCVILILCLVQAEGIFCFWVIFWTCNCHLNNIRVFCCIGACLLFFHSCKYQLSSKIKDPFRHYKATIEFQLYTNSLLLCSCMPCAPSIPLACTQLDAKFQLQHNNVHILNKKDQHTLT